MIIRKSFEIINSHIVRNCSSIRCKKSLHWHKYLVEVFFESDSLDNGMMVMDFGLTKWNLKEFISSFNLAYSMWKKESPEFQEEIKKATDRWVIMPVSPSAEAYSLLFLSVIDSIIKNTKFNNGEWNIRVSSVRVHETETGYAESFRSDLENPKMPKFSLNDIIFSEGVKESWKNKTFFDDLVNWTPFEMPTVEQQV